MQISARCILYSGTLGLLVGLGAGSGTVYWWYARQPVKVTTIQGPTKTIVVTKPIRIYVGQKSRRVIPKSVQRNTKAHVVAGTTVHHRQVTAVLDAGTGLTSLYVQPRSFFSSGRRTTLSVYEGVFGVPGLAPRVDSRLQVTERLFRIGSVHVDGQGTYDTVGGYFVGVGVDYRW